MQRLLFAFLLMLAPAFAFAEGVPAPADATVPVETSIPTTITPADTPAASVPAPLTYTAIEGPASLTLGAEVLLDLPAGWSFIPKEQLRAYFAASQRAAGNWDLGCALSPGATPAELRLQFEPLGAVDDKAGLSETLALLARVQQTAGVANARRRALGQSETQILSWDQAPAYTQPERRLLWAERRASNGEEHVGWHLRLLGRGGVVKLDLQEAPDVLAEKADLAAALAAGLSFKPGRSLDARLPSDKASPLNLDALVLDGIFGRGALAGGNQREPLPLWGWIAGSLALAAALAAGALKAWRAFDSWRKAKAKAAAKEAQAREYERTLGASADDVEEIVEEE